MSVYLSGRPLLHHTQDPEICPQYGKQKELLDQCNFSHYPHTKTVHGIFPFFKINDFV